MKITCKYCGTLFDDVEEKCPHCNGENPNVRKGDINNPTTIEDLKEWYEQRNLPPYDVTRFFIGIDTKEARAFGIYKEGDKIVVYKNKDDGKRAVRYEGTDEAFGVNEIFMRLKQEIVNQKSLNNCSDVSSTTDSISDSSDTKKTKFSISDLLLYDPWELFKKKPILRIVIDVLLLFICFLMVFGMFEDDKSYKFGVVIGFLASLAGIGIGGFLFVRIFLSWLSNCVSYKLDIIKGLIFVALEGIISLILIGASLITAICSIALIDYPDWHLRSGYYISQVDQDAYYYTYKWYFYDNGSSQWKLCDDETTPKTKDLVFNGTDGKSDSLNFEKIGSAYAGEEYNPSFAFSNFLESVAYSDEVNGYCVDPGYYNYNDDIYYHLDLSNQSGWYYYDDNSNDWSEAESTEVPDDLKHQMVAKDFWFTPTWDSSTQFYDFEESEVYSEYLEEEANKSSINSDSSYDWGSSDSWDSGSTDWGSDW